MKKIWPKKTLVYYDGPQVLEAVDSIGGRYIAVLVESVSQTYMIVGVEPEHLRRFRTGALDLRSLLVDHAELEWYLGAPGEHSDSPFVLKEQSKPLVETAFLPDGGLFLTAGPPTSETLAEARQRNNLVMEVVVEPPEAASENRIRLKTLALLLSEIQLLAKHAYRRAIRDVPPAIKKFIDQNEGPLFDVVVPAAPGSFRIVLEAAQEPDLVGNSELARALQRIDDLFLNVKDPNASLAVVKENKGHLAGAYIRLLRLLIDNDTNLRYSWAEPSSPETHSRSIARVEAATLVALFAQVSNLESEEVELQGKLRKADMLNGTWKLETECGILHGTRKAGGPTLAGLETDAAYKFKCLEEIVVSEKGTEQRELYLIDHEPL